MKRALLGCIMLLPIFAVSCADGELTPSETNCVNNPQICLASQKCDQDKKICVTKDCTDEPNVCLTSQKCDQTKKSCIPKTCKDDPTICKGNQKCDEAREECVNKSCMDEPSVCHINEKCNTSGQCEIKTCDERCKGKHCGSNNECYDSIKGEPDKYNEPIICTRIPIPKNIDYLVEAIQSNNAVPSDESCETFYNTLMNYYKNDESSQTACMSDPLCGDPASFAYCNQHHVDALMEVILGKTVHTSSKEVNIATINIFTSIAKKCLVTFSE